jgi:hypothetical protein
MSGLKLGNPVLFSVGTVADNPSLHVNIPIRLARMDPRSGASPGSQLGLTRHVSSNAGARASGLADATVGKSEGNAI